jgi:hypothetical protein
VPIVNGQTLESVPTQDLRQGDTVLLHGMVLSLDKAIESYQSDGVTVYWTSALVTNPADVRTDPMLWGFLHDQRWVEGKGWERYYSGRWTVQGNHLAHWARVVKD